MYEFSAEIQALRWTCLIFEPIRIQTRPANNAHEFFSRILTKYCQTESVKNCLNLYHCIGDFRGYSLCKNDINVIGLSPILGAHFSPEDVSPEDLDQLSAMGRFVQGNSEDAVKDSLNKVLDSINSHAEENLLDGNVKRAIDTIKYSLALTGGKDSKSMEIANKMAKSLDSPTPCVTH